MNQYTIITLTHKQLPLHQLGKFVIPDSTLEAVAGHLSELKAQFHLDELLYVATCNRVAFFMVGPDHWTTERQFQFFQATFPNLPAVEIHQAVNAANCWQGERAIQHLFEVASSLDALVVGEREILKQLRDAYDNCKAWGLTGDAIRLAIDQAIVTAKKVFTDTAIAERPVSVVSLGAQALLQAGVKKDARFLIVGAGETNNLLAKYLLKYNFTHFKVFNRSLPKAVALAEKLGGKAFALKALQEYNEAFDVLVTCTGATDPIITKDILSKWSQTSSSQKIILDLGLPADVDQSVLKGSNIVYIHIEQLQALAQKNKDFRKTEMVKAEKIIREQVINFEIIFKEREIEKVLHRIPEQVAEVRSHAVNKVFAKDIQNLDEQSRLVLEKVLTYMEKKCISIPMRVAKQGFLGS